MLLRPLSVNLCHFFPATADYFQKISYLCIRIFNLNTYFDTIMANSFTDKIEWTLIFAMEFGRHFGLTLKQAFNYLSRFGAIKFIDEHYDYCHTQSFQSMVSDMAEYCHRKGGALL